MHKYTKYFEDDVLAKRPYIKKEWCEHVLNNPVHSAQQPDGRYRFWSKISEFGNRYLRVVTLPDKKTILNAFFDRNFKGGKYNEN